MKKTKDNRPLFIRACFGEKTERAPVWIMRQAGRYLPEYRAVRATTTFLGLCKTPELAAEVTLQPVDLVGVDAAIIFSDILIVPEAMGQTLTVEEKQGPRLFPIIQTAADVRKLKKPKPEKAYAFLGKALKLVRTQLDPEIPLIGFAGSPFTLMAYMIEGQGTKEFEKVKALLKENPKLVHQLLEKLSNAVADLLNYKIKSGAQAVQIFDSWGGILNEKEFAKFSLAYVKKVIKKLNRKKVPVIFFAKGTGKYLKKIKSCGADVIGLDWNVNLKWARKILGKKIAIQGNLDPMTLFSSPSMIQDAVKNILSQINPRQGYIFNLGHGILPTTPPEHAKYLVQCVKELSAK